MEAAQPEDLFCLPTEEKGHKVDPNCTTGPPVRTVNGELTEPAPEEPGVFGGTHVRYAAG